MSALVLLLPVSKIQAGANKIMLASMRSFFYQADVYGSAWILYISVLSLGRSVITSQCTPRFFSLLLSWVSHFAGRRVFSFPKNSRERLDSLLPLATQMKKKRAKPSSRQHLALILLPAAKKISIHRARCNPNVEHKSIEIFLYL